MSFSRRLVSDCCSACNFDPPVSSHFNSLSRRSARNPRAEQHSWGCYGRSWGLLTAEGQRPGTRATSGSAPRASTTDDASPPPIALTPSSILSASPYRSRSHLILGPVFVPPRSHSLSILNLVSISLRSDLLPIHDPVFFRSSILSTSPPRSYRPPHLAHFVPSISPIRTLTIRSFRILDPVSILPRLDPLFTRHRTNPIPNLDQSAPINGCGPWRPQAGL